MSRPPETLRQRHARLHRRIKAAGYLPQRTLGGCERQAAMLDSGELKPQPPATAGQRRAMENTERRYAARDAARCDSEDAEAEWTAQEYRERATEERLAWERGTVAGSDAFNFRDPPEEP